MDANPEAAGFLGAGPDKVLGTTDDLDVDLGISPYWSLEGFTGLQDSRFAIIYGLGSSEITGVSKRELPWVEVSNGFNLGMVYPNPSSHQARLPIMVKQPGFLELQIYDQLGRLRMTIYEDQMSRGDSEVLLPVDLLVSGIYSVRTRFGEEILWRRFVVVR